MSTYEISIICPVFNEIDFIEDLIRFLEKVEPVNKEIIFIDGGSNDGTVETINAEIRHNTNIRLLHNKKKIVPFALNMAIPQCKADIISRIDAHTEYAPDYFTKILETFEKVDADIVGGPTRTKARNNVQHAVAHAICTRFAIGGSLVHQEDYRGYSDSVTFGAWRKKMFEKTGLFDTDLKRNQDDEFHYRSKSLGFKIYQEPDIKLWYYPRNTLAGLFRQYYQYGLYKPMVLRKIRSEIKLRHLAPAGFVLYLALCLFACFWWPVLIPLFLYVLLDLMFTLKSGLTNRQKLILFIVYPTIHISYGIGFLRGLFKSRK